MSECNATLTTATVDHPCESPTTSARTEGVFCDGVQHVTLHTITCSYDDTHSPGAYHFDTNGVCWSDNTPGATPRAEPLVTEAEAQAMADVWMARFHYAPGAGDTRLIWKMAKAASKVRRATEGTNP
jgi:hypothetical protein